MCGGVGGGVGGWKLVGDGEGGEEQVRSLTAPEALAPVHRRLGPSRTRGLGG